MSEDKMTDSNKGQKPIDKNGEVIDNKKKQQDRIKSEDKSSIKKMKKFKLNNITKIVAVALVGIICLGVGFSYGKSVGRELPATAKKYSANKVFATVGDVSITGKELQYRMDPLFYLQGKSKLTDEEISAYEYSMLDYMTTTEMLYLEAKSNNIEVTEDEIEEEYETTMSSITQSFGMTEDEYLKEFGLTKDYIKKDLEKELIAVKYMGEVTDVSEEEAKNYYDKNKDEFFEVRGSHILIKTTDDEGNELSDDEKAKRKEKAEEILKKAKAGEDFDTLAEEYSEDTSATNGGDLGFFKKGDMVESFENAVFSLDNNQIYDEIVETDYGYHIIKKTGEQYASFEDEKEDLISQLSYNKQNTLLDDLEAKYEIEIKE